MKPSCEAKCHEGYFVKGNIDSWQRGDSRPTYKLVKLVMDNIQVNSIAARLAITESPPFANIEKYFQVINKENK